MPTYVGPHDDLVDSDLWSSFILDLDEKTSSHFDQNLNTIQTKNLQNSQAILK